MSGKQHVSVAVRIFYLGLTVLIQGAALVGVFVFFRDHFALFYGVCELLSLFVVLYIVREDTNPTYKIPWIILNLALPILGGLVYVMLGHVRFSREERKRGKTLLRSSREALSLRPDAGDRVPLEYANQSHYLKTWAGAPAYTNTAVRFFPLGEDFWAALLPELEAAEKFIFMEYFIIGPGKMWGAIEEVLKRKAAAGVDVRVIYDDIGCLGLVPGNFDKRLAREGIPCIAFNRFTNIFSSRFNNRDHRKICVIDGNVGYTGGINLADEYINAYEKHGHWKDTAVELRGDAVWSLTVQFAGLWNYERRKDEDLHPFLPTKSVVAPGIVQPYTDIPTDGEYVGERVYMDILNRARKYVYITTPYLIIDNEMITALTGAAKSGVDVRIITPGIPDKKLVYRLTRSYYDVLLRAGVRIFEYTPGFVHAKEFIADDRCAVVGTINLDYRSLCHHFECAAWMCDVPVIGEIKADFLATQERCREITPEICRRECGRNGVLLSVLRIFAPLM